MFRNVGERRKREAREEAETNVKGGIPAVDGGPDGIGLEAFEDEFLYSHSLAVVEIKTLTRALKHMAFWKPGTAAPGSIVDRETEAEGGSAIVSSSLSKYASLGLQGQRQRLPIYKHSVCSPSVLSFECWADVWHVRIQGIDCCTSLKSTRL